MSDFHIAPEARSDLGDIWAYYAIEARNPDVADKIIEEFFAAFRKLAQMPGMGHLRRDLANEPVRFWAVRSYLIIYRTKKPLEVVRIIHGARDVQAILGGGNAIQED